MDRRRTVAAALIGLSVSGCAWNQARMANVPNSAGIAPVSLSNQPGRVRPNPAMPRAATAPAPEGRPAMPAPEERSASRPTLPSTASQPAPQTPSQNREAKAPAEPLSPHSVGATGASPSQNTPPATVAEPPEQVADSAPPQTPEPEAKLDPAIQRTALETEEKPALSEDPGEPANVVIARVGDTVVTTSEFGYAVRDRIRGPEYARLPREQQLLLQKQALEYVIDRAMLIQEARKRLKNPKQWDAFKDSIEKDWTDRELPALIAHAHVANEYELEQALARDHQSLSEIHENFLLDNMGRAYLSITIRDKLMAPSFNDIYAYYEKNKDRPEFQQTAHVNWRLIFVPIDDSTDRATAQKIILAAHARLQRGEDFATVSKQVSKDPRAQEGGLWSTGYESYASEKVNQALKTLPINQLGPVLEDDRGFYIIRVEARRRAGAKPFPEVQQSISDALSEERFRDAMEKYLQDLRRMVPVSCHPGIEGSPLEPKQLHPERIGAEN
jgi:hypothetical protein